jgi:hypothetical protein
VSGIGDHALTDRRSTAWRTRYALLGGVVFLASAVIGWHFFGGRGEVLKTRWRTGRDGDGFWAKLLARSAPIWLAASEFLDTFADDDVFRSLGWRGEHAVRNP